MTQEEKANAYDEALEKAKEMMGNTCSSEQTKCICQELFPELKESEDERIRNLLYCIVRDRSDVCKILEANGCSVDKALAYLENQKDEEPIMDSIKFEEGYKTGYDVGKCDGYQEGYKVGIEKQKEQKSIIQDVELNDAVYDYVRDHFIACADFTPEYIKKLMENAFFAGVDYYLLKQKPAEWSVFDACVLDDAITATDLLGNGEEYKESHPNLAKAFRVAKDWLKDLPNRISLQPKQEWSEEDEKMIKDFLHKVEVCDLLTNKENVWIVRKLKSLRPQPHWKPTEEQIRKLNIAINCFEGDWGEDSARPLRELYEELKNYSL